MSSDKVGQPGEWLDSTPNCKLHCKPHNVLLSDSTGPGALIGRARASHARDHEFDSGVASKQ